MIYIAIPYGLFVLHRELENEKGANCDDVRLPRVDGHFGKP